MDSITGACPESCYCAPDENRTTTVSPNDWNSTCVVPWDRYQACTNHSGCDADQYCDEFGCVAGTEWMGVAGGWGAALIEMRGAGSGPGVVLATVLMLPSIFVFFVGSSCYVCSYCTEVENDAIDGTCPENCPAAITTTEAPMDYECTDHSSCGVGGYCDTYVTPRHCWLGFRHCSGRCGSCAACACADV